MKTQNFGWSLSHGSLAMSPLTAAGEAKVNYQGNRSNGGDEDSPSGGLPLDGAQSDWIKCPDKDTLPTPQADGSYKEGWNGNGYYRIRYQEGHGDKAWMEERDGNYLARIEREGQTEEAARLYASLPPCHPHYRPRTPALPAPSVPLVPTVASGRAASSTAGAGAGAAASPAPAVTLFQAVGRVWAGKYATRGTQPMYVAHAKKTEGCAIGAIYRKTPSKPGASHAGKLWLGKVGFNQSERDERALRTHSLVRRGSSVDSIREKIAADTYALLSRGQYFVPKHRLATLPVINEFTRENVLAQTLVEEMNRCRTERKDIAVHLMSKWIEGYHNLDTALVKNSDGSTGPIMTYIEAQHTLPEQIVVDGREIPLLGMMEVLAAARLLGDTDVLGGGGKNAGYVIERNSDGVPVAARAVKIDAGNAFNFEGADNRFTQCFNRRARPSMRLANLRDLQFGNNMPVDIEWDKLTDGQRSAFLSALQHGLDCLKIPMTLRFLIKRDGEFNRAETDLLSDSVVSELIEIWERDLREQESEEVYGTMLAEIRSSASPPP